LRAAEPPVAPASGAPAAGQGAGAPGATAAPPGPGSTPGSSAQPSAAPAAFTDPAQAAAAQRAWWNLLQQQFNQIAGAAAATLQGTDAGSTPKSEPEPARGTQTAPNTDAPAAGSRAPANPNANAG